MKEVLFGSHTGTYCQCTTIVGNNAVVAHSSDLRTTKSSFESLASSADIARTTPRHLVFYAKDPEEDTMCKERVETVIRKRQLAPLRGNVSRQKNEGRSPRRVMFVTMPTAGRPAGTRWKTEGLAQTPLNQSASSHRGITGTLSVRRLELRSSCGPLLVLLIEGIKQGEQDLVIPRGSSKQPNDSWSGRARRRRRR